MRFSSGLALLLKTKRRRGRFQGTPLCRSGLCAEHCPVRGGRTGTRIFSAIEIARIGAARFSVRIRQDQSCSLVFRIQILR
jgi:hypothetical protein